MAMIENLTPILQGRRSRSEPLLLHQDLGFSLKWDAGMKSVSREGQSIMLGEGAQRQPGVWLWIGVEDADVFFAEFSAKGAQIRSPPKNFSWAYKFMSKILTATFSALGLSQRQGRRMESSGGNVGAFGVVVCDMTNGHDFDAIWPGIAVSAIFWLVVLVVGGLLIWLFWT